MFIELTKIDGRPIWINAAFVVTVEPRRGDGAIVVPIGDGLDYDVRESPERVLELLAGAPAARVVPIPVSVDKTRLPADGGDDLPPVRECAGTALPAPNAAESTATGGAEAPAAGEGAHAATRRPRTRKPRGAAPVPPSAGPELTDEQIDRLRKMAPRSVRKLRNTLSTQFGVADAAAAEEFLVARGVLSVDRDHLVWSGAQGTDAAAGGK